MTSDRPSIDGVLETVLYYHDQQRALAFYRDVIGMRLIDHEPGRSLFFRAGTSVFLLFDADRTRAGGKLPGHGASGAIHTCFRVPRADYERWKSHLEAHDVLVIRQVDWPGGRSFYFHDPDGNLLEIADADFWPR